MIPGQPTESLFPRGLGKVALHPRRPTTAIIPAALPSAAPPRLENQSRYEKSGLILAYNDLLLLIGGLFVVVLTLIPMVRRPRSAFAVDRH